MKGIIERMFIMDTQLRASGRMGLNGEKYKTEGALWMYADHVPWTNWILFPAPKPGEGGAGDRDWLICVQQQLLTWLV